MDQNSTLRGEIILQLLIMAKRLETEKVEYV